MTIAAGFVYQDGVLLCADSEVNSTSKALGQKLGAFAGPWGLIGCAFAGNVDFAAGAFQKLNREIESWFEDDDYKGLEDTAEQVLGEFYERHVLNHPRREQSDLDYSLVLVLREPGNRPKLYGTQETVVREITNFQCVGLGQDFAEYIAKIHFRPGLEYSRLLALAGYALAIAKQNATMCGGPTMFLNIPNAGNISGITEEPIATHMENVCGWFEQEARTFLLSHMGSTDEFKKQIQALTNAALLVRDRWNSHPLNPTVRTASQDSERDQSA